MTAARRKFRHPSAAVLVRHLDGELDEVTTQRLRRHLRGCERCGDRLARVQRASIAAGEDLRDWQSGVPVPELARARALEAVRSAQRRRGRVGMGVRGWIAAALLGVIVLGFGVEPVRAWVMQRLGVEAGEVDVTAGVPRLPETVVDGAGAVVSFGPAATVLTIHVENRQAAGELILQALPLEQATAQVIGEEGGALLVLPGGMRIENSADSRASYRVTVPPGVRQVEVRLAGEPPLLVDVTGEGWERRVPVGAD